MQRPNAVNDVRAEMRLESLTLGLGSFIVAEDIQAFEEILNHRYHEIDRSHLCR